MPELKIYTVKDLREWLENDHPAEGLSERVIAPTRAWAIVHNPYVKDEDAIVAAIFEDGELAAYTASFPEMLDGKRIWWCSTLYCYPQFAGHGYGMIVVGSLMEAHEPDLTYDRWGATETVEICNHLGLQTTYTKRYHLTDKKIDTTSLKGKLAYCAQELKKWFHPWPKQKKANYTVQYVERIDKEAYSFMQSHRKNDLWLREQEMLNWIVGYPFFESGKWKVKSGRDSECFFSSAAMVYTYQVAKVYVREELQGVYMLRQHNEKLSVVYLYYAEEFKDAIFNSILVQIIQAKPEAFITENADVYAYVRGRLYFPKTEKENVSFSVPAGIELPTNYTLQLGDGDSFA